jgi:hypothetical protein
MSALPPKADITGRRMDVRFVPIGDIVAQIGSAGDPPAVRHGRAGGTDGIVVGRSEYSHLTKPFADRLC